MSGRGAMVNSGIHKDGGAEHGRVSAFFDRLFREREVMVRSEGRVAYMRLTPRLQKMTAGVALGVLVWAAAASGGAYWQNTVIGEKNREISEAKLAFEQLQDDLATYQQRIAAATGTLSGRLSGSGGEALLSARDLQGFLNDLGVIDDLNIKLASIVEQIQVDSETPDTDRERIIASRQVLHDRIDLLRSTLSETRERETELAVTVTKLSARVDAIRTKEQKVSGERDQLETRLAEMDTQLLESRTQVGDLSRTVRETRAALRRSEEQHGEIVEQRTALTSRVEVLERALADARERGDGLAVNVASLQRELSSLEETHSQSLDARTDAERELAQLGAKLATADALWQRTDDRLADLVDRLRAESREGGMTVVMAAGPRDTADSLDHAVDDLIGELALVREQKQTAEATLQTVVADLREVAGKSIHLDDAGPVDAARALLADIRSLHETQEEVVAALINRTDRQIESAERMFEIAGLKPDHLTALGLPVVETGQGGPFFALDAGGGSAQDLENNVALLNEKAEQWENLESVLACTPWISPVDNYHLTSGFGKRRDPINGKMAMHKGVDLAGWPKTPVYATAPGTVTKAGRDGRYGKYIEIDHGCGVVTRYAHLSKILVKRGDTVTHRQKIGRLGNTGRSTGPHVHYEIRINGTPVDPIKFFEAGRMVFKS